MFGLSGSELEQALLKGLLFLFLTPLIEALFIISGQDLRGLMQ